ncbi:PilZ domain-containing protein [Granulicella tundricola]|uniref:Type IV pilus assembly PilZ n=1 Tax=Granulicella tundricola (strain ATCC BAA-1859 / DSM 23138 / MP5ACTX9) TaxID=1198114 RepID=E8WYZ9_GRATM|nr:PilZ domain-containing protein [Granulicella tundricola]ADW69914.1 type IV pilus assembly PilZ [Granulicella tundricola MP5ACTX9]
MFSQAPRPARFDLNLALTFAGDEGVLEGHCVNVSASGMLAAFARPVELFTNGELSLLVGEFYVNVKARVARTQGFDAGLAFIIETENDRHAVRLLVEFATAQHQPERQPDAA